MTAVALPRLSGTAAVVRFNWPKFVAAAAVGLAAVVAVAAGTSRPPAITAGVAAVGLAAVTWSVTSVLATWWTYDHRQVYDRVVEGLGEVGDWTAVHAGFDEATPRSVSIIGPPAVAAVALSTRARRSLRRARRVTRGATGEPPPGEPTGLRLATRSLDTIFITMAVHEVRDRSAQRALFAELRRVLRPGGRLVITEHHRSIRNAAVFGPAVWHFQPRQRWVDEAAGAGFERPRDVALTPFVHRMVWCAPTTSGETIRECA